MDIKRIQPLTCVPVHGTFIVITETHMRCRAQAILGGQPSIPELGTIFGSPIGLELFDAPDSPLLGWIPC